MRPPLLAASLRRLIYCYSGRSMATFPTLRGLVARALNPPPLLFHLTFTPNIRSHITYRLLLTVAVRLPLDAPAVPHVEPEFHRVPFLKGKGTRFVTLVACWYASLHIFSYEAAGT